MCDAALYLAANVYNLCDEIIQGNLNIQAVSKIAYNFNVADMELEIYQNKGSARSIVISYMIYWILTE